MEGTLGKEVLGWGEEKENTSRLDETDPWFLGYTLSDRPSVAFANVASYLFLSPLSCFACHYREMEKRNARLDFSPSRVKNGGKETHLVVRDL